MKDVINCAVIIWYLLSILFTEKKNEHFSSIDLQRFTTRYLLHLKLCWNNQICEILMIEFRVVWPRAWKADQPKQINVYHITRTLQASPIKLQQIRQETAKDNTMPLLRDIIYKRWPNSRSECPLPLCDFWNFREDRTTKHMSTELLGYFPETEFFFSCFWWRIQT